MSDEPYSQLVEIYEWLVPQELTTPEGSVAAFGIALDGLAPGARVLDCAAGTGWLAVGLALAGFGVAASDASPAMVERTARLAAERGVALDARLCRWEQLHEQGWADSFEAVFCVGNSLAHAAGQAARRAALGQMGAVLRPGGRLVLTSRNWELVRAQGSGLRIADELVERRDRPGLVINGWTIPDDWDEPHLLDTGVALIDPDGGRVTSRSERLPMWPFRHQTLAADLRAVGLEPQLSTYAADVDRYLVTAQSPQRPRTTT